MAVVQLLAYIYYCNGKSLCRIVVITSS